MGFSPMAGNPAQDEPLPPEATASTPNHSKSSEAASSSHTNSLTVSQSTTAITPSTLPYRRPRSLSKEKKIIPNFDTIEGEYHLQRTHRMPVNPPILKESFNPLHQHPTRCSLTACPPSSFLTQIFVEAQSERRLELPQSKQTLDDGFLLVYNKKDSLFIDRYYHQPKQRYDMHPRGISPATTTQSFDSTPRKRVTIAHWPHHIRCKRYPSCHLLYHTEEQESHELAIVIGFSTGEILVYEPWCESSCPRVHTQIVTCHTAATCMAWVPGHEGQWLLCGFMDGSVNLLDLHCKPVSNTVPTAETMLHSLRQPELFSIWRNPQGATNPLTKWQLCTEPVYDLQFSPNGQYVAVACGDGFARVISTEKRYHYPAPRSSTGDAGPVQQGFSVELGKATVTFQSYFGAIRCLDWSPDGEYLLTGGEDDLVSVWSMTRLTLAVRGKGHHSWVSSVAFDPWRCQDGTYRFGSVGQDGRLILWDYSWETVHRPRSRSLKVMRRRSRSATMDPPPMSTPERKAIKEGLVIHAPGCAEIPWLEPVVEHQAHYVPAHSILFTQQSILTAGNEPSVRVWARPGHYVSPPQPEFVLEIPEPEDIGSLLSNISLDFLEGGVKEEDKSLKESPPTITEADYPPSPSTLKQKKEEDPSAPPRAETTEYRPQEQSTVFSDDMELQYDLQ